MIVDCDASTSDQLMHSSEERSTVSMSIANTLPPAETTSTWQTVAEGVKPEVCLVIGTEI